VIALRRVGAPGDDAKAGTDTADAAADAAAAAAYASADRIKSQKQTADIVRKYIPVKLIKEKL